MDKKFIKVINKIKQCEELTSKEEELFVSGIPYFKNTIEVVAKKLIGIFIDITPTLVDLVTKLQKLKIELEEENEILINCPNKRVVHLARYAKKYRTRKKNLNRAYKIVRKGKG